MLVEVQFILVHIVYINTFKSGIGGQKMLLQLTILGATVQLDYT
ncbi:hypothetical protein N824_16565 [Pedobacter sp. V48]|nr:hypothetical protein N824_16565 [Pedobacter sp. V48]